MALALGCSSPADPEPVSPEPIAGCAPGSIERADGSCLAAGIPAEQCAAGFEPTEDAGCQAVLPGQPCEAGSLALPGDTSCRELAPCGEAPWGEIPVEADTQYVDQSYLGGDSDGGADRPWTTIADGVQAAAPGAIVAVAAGVYGEDLFLEQKPIRLWGRCPTMVEIAGTGASPGGVMATVTLFQAPGVELHDLAISGPGRGIVVGDVQSVLLDRLWVHDTGGHGIYVQHNGGATDARLAGSLVERTHFAGVTAVGAQVQLEGSVVRETLIGESQGHRFGRGIGIQDDQDSGERAVVEVTGSLIVRNGLMGVFVGGSDVTIDATVIGNIHDPLPAEGDAGLMAIHGPTAGRRANAVLRRSVVAGSFAAGIAATGSDVLVEATVIRDTVPRQSDLFFGRGLSASYHVAMAEPAVVTLRQSVIERSHDAGVMLSGSEAHLESTIVRDTAPAADSGQFGRGVTVQMQAGSGVASTAEVLGCLVAHSHEQGIVVLGSELTLADTAVIDTRLQQSDGLFGDSLSVASVFKDMDGTPRERVASAQVYRTLLAEGARAGVGNFGGHVGITAVSLECNTIDLDGEEAEGISFTFEDGGGNRCGCGGEQVTCQVVSSGLLPPPLPGQ